MLISVLCVLGLAIAYSVVYDYFLYRVIQESRKVHRPGQP